jgi:hypothetical protein
MEEGVMAEDDDPTDGEDDLGGDDDERCSQCGAHFEDEHADHCPYADDDV